MMIAIQLNEPWIALGILAISILTSKEISTVIAFILATVVIYFAIGSGDESYWLVAIFALIIIAIVLGSKGEPSQDAGGLGGLGGYGDMLGMGGGY